ncbi:hypothetical protein GH714_035058 [Hevea brasiliensis]|uniref:PAZ domain-containing protein n=1 Tax=Hevea brasiliensis TaxID=3981 RepID=A0A6A6KVL3_HEVBR|nr:hypothetical protein GH714_035058 [Hevea brasiliensis]
MEEAGGSCPKPTKRSIIARPGFGSSGHPIPLLSNHFKVSVNVTDVVFYQYSVSITAEDNRVVDEKRKIIDRLCQTYSCELAGKSFAYDGEKTLYSLVRLPQSWMEFTVVPGNQLQNGKAGASVRQTFFHDDPKNFTDVGGGITGVRGYHSSFRTTHGACLLIWAKSMLKILRVKPRHRNMEYKIIGLSQKVYKEQYFSMKVRSHDCANGEPQVVKITVYEYFTKHCGIELTDFACLPCLDVGNTKQPIYLPIELCTLVPLQRYAKALFPTLKASLVASSRQNP